jgi:hypothetical protein
MKTGYTVLLLIFFAAVMAASLAYADSCPYCGQQYGDAAPGDEARVYSLRQEHEATCPSRPSGTVYGQGAAGYGAAAAARRAEEERIRQEEEQLQIDRETARRARSEKMKRDREELARQQREFEAGKKDLLSSLKGGAAGPVLKDGTTMPVVNPMKLRGQEKGVHFKEVPAPGKIRPEDLPLFAKNRTALVLDALQHRKDNWEESIGYLEDELAKGKGAEQPNLQEAISYLEGIRDAEASAEGKKPEPEKQRPADPASSVVVDQILLEMASRRNGQNVVWPGQKNTSAPLPNPLGWKEERLTIAADGFIHGGYDLDKSIQYLKEKAEKAPVTNGSAIRTIQAAQYLEGVRAYADYRESLDKQKK